MDSYDFFTLHQVPKNQSHLNVQFVIYSSLFLLESPNQQLSLSSLKINSQCEVHADC